MSYLNTNVQPGAYPPSQPFIQTTSSPYGGHQPYAHEDEFPIHLDGDYHNTTTYLAPVEKFVPDTEWRDKFFVGAFLAHLLAIVILFFVATIKDPLQQYDGWIPNFGLPDFTPVFGVLVIGTIFAIVFSSLVYTLARYKPVPFIYAAFIFNGLLFLAGIIIFAILRNWVGVFFWCIGLLMAGLFYFFARPFIPFAAELLSVTSSISQQYTSTTIISLICGLVQLGEVLFFGALVFLTQYRFSLTTVQFLTVFYLFSFFWVSQVIRNVLHTSLSGLFASWYFLSGTDAMPASPMMGSFKRAVTTSFGSICLGSLLVAFIQMLRVLARGGRGSRNGCAAVLSVIMECILNLLERVVRYINFYAYVYIAVYGKSFFQAAGAAMDLMINNGLLNLINDDITGNVLMMACMAGSLLSALVTGIVSMLMGLPGSQVAYCAGAGLVFGWFIMSMLLQSIESGVATIFVCYAENSEPLQRSHPSLYEKIAATTTAQIMEPSGHV